MAQHFSIILHHYLGWYPTVKVVNLSLYYLNHRQLAVPYLVIPYTAQSVHVDLVLSRGYYFKIELFFLVHAGGVLVSKRYHIDVLLTPIIGELGDPILACDEYSRYSIRSWVIFLKAGTDEASL